MISDSQVRQHVADAVDDLDEFGMRLLEAVHRRTQAAHGKLAQLRILFCARGLVRGNFREIGDALRLLVVGFLQGADLGFQPAEQLEQFAPARLADGAGAPDFRLNLANRLFDHVGKVMTAENIGKQS